MEIKDEFIKIMLEQKDKIKLRYKQIINDIQEHYGIDFDISYLKNERINIIKFLNLKAPNGVNNLSISYDNFNNYFNNIIYEYDDEIKLKSFKLKELIPSIEKQFKLQIIVDELNRANNNYLKEIEQMSIQIQYLKEND